MILTLFRLIALPHELLHALAYLIMRKPYRRHAFFIEAMGELTRRQQLFVDLLPFTVTGFVATGLVLAAPIVARLADHPFWLALYGAIAIGALVYASFSIADLRKAYQTWTGHKRTPFDALIELNAQILFQPRENLRVVWVMMVILVFVLIYLLTGLA